MKAAVILLSQVEAGVENGDGRVQVRLVRALVDDAGNVLQRGQYHRYAIEPGENPDEVHAREAGSPALKGFESHSKDVYDPIHPDIKAKVKAICALEHTPEVVAAHKAKNELRQAEQARQRKEHFAQQLARQHFLSTPEGKAAQEAMQKAVEDAAAAELAAFAASEEGKSMVQQAKDDLTRAVAAARKIA